MNHCWRCSPGFADGPRSSCSLSVPPWAGCCSPNPRLARNSPPRAACYTGCCCAPCKGLSLGLAAARAGFGARKGRGAAPAPNQLSMVSVSLFFFFLLLWLPLSKGLLLPYVQGKGFVKALNHRCFPPRIGAFPLCQLLNQLLANLLGANTEQEGGPAGSCAVGS